MTPQEDHEMCLRICNGNKEAFEWMQLLRTYAHLSDDVIDEPAMRQEHAARLCVLGALALRLYTHPFFVRYSSILSGAMLSNIADYALSVKWEDETGWKKQCADWLRHGQIRMVQTIAAICGGYEHMRSFGEDLWAFAYELHHDAEGKPI